ncbi:hypothetical protein [Acinetobacter soli]|uniref:Lipoprotein n=1 Tax=Acinetobacter soli TaxID=487316 RepID=A0A1P8EJ53_9GAMM|nr:hypothetical protein [Acinetobacter soli]APV36243.1 hypothetical protein BEN76_09505 [Acinetobacter soli]
MTKLKAILASVLVTSTVLTAGCVVDPFGYDGPHHRDGHGRYDRDHRGWDDRGRYDRRGWDDRR